MKKAIVFLANGFEEMEATGTIDILRRGGVEVTIVTINSSREVTGAHGMVYMADQTLAEADCTTADALILPGGMPGATNLNACEPLRELLKAHYAQEKLVAAICAAPLVLGGLGFLQGRKATCYPGFEDKLYGAQHVSDGVVTDGNITTCRGLGYAIALGLEIIRLLLGEEKSLEIKAAIQRD